MKRTIAIISLAIAAVAYGADVTVTSCWDEETQTWIGDAVALTNALKKCAAGDVI